MALIFLGHTTCSICGKVVASADNSVATSHFIADKNDPLWQFSDSAMHQVCFLGWDLRQSFVDRYNATVGKIIWGDGSRQEMQPDGRIESSPQTPR